MPITSSSQPKRPRGFAAMDPQKQRAISALGGKAAHRSGNAHEFSSDEARAAGALSHAHRRSRVMMAETPNSSGKPRQAPQG